MTFDGMLFVFDGRILKTSGRHGLDAHRAFQFTLFDSHDVSLIGNTKVMEIIAIEGPSSYTATVYVLGPNLGHGVWPLWHRHGLWLLSTYGSYPLEDHHR